MILATCPNYDPATRYIASWARVLLGEAKAKGIETVELEGKKASRAEFEGRVRKMDPSFVLLNGHGAADRVTGQDGEVLVHAGENPDVLNGRITYAVSCDSGAVLGDVVGSQIASTYIGYTKEFAMLQSHGYFKDPVRDPLARPFMDFSNQIVRGLLKGQTAVISVEKAKQAAEATVSLLLSSVSDPDSQAAARFLWWDIKCVTVKGDQNKTI